MQGEPFDDFDQDNAGSVRHSDDSVESRRLSALQVSFLVAGVVIALVGALLSTTGTKNLEARGADGGPSSSLITSFSDTRSPSSNTEEGSAPLGISTDSVWGPALLQGGFGAFLGFSLGYASRFFLRFVLVGVGAFFAGVMLMEYLGWVTVEWERIGAAFDRFLEIGEAQLASLQGFFASRLPAVGVTIAGFWVGWRKG